MIAAAAGNETGFRLTYVISNMLNPYPRSGMPLSQSFGLMLTGESIGCYLTSRLSVLAYEVLAAVQTGGGEADVKNPGVSLH